jgi:cell division protein FtsQ
MKKVLQIGGWSIFTLGVLVLLFFVNAGYDNVETQKPEITIIKTGNHNFVTEEKVLGLMSDLGYSFQEQSLGDIELERIEEEVGTIPGVKDVQAYKYSNGVVHLDIEQQLPVARVILQGGKMGCYIDADGEIIPLSEDYIAKVPVFTGYIYEPYNDIPSVNEITQTDSISELHVLDEIHTLALALNQDEFLAAQILQVYVNEKEEFEMIPRVGNHRILFGGIDDYEDKLFRLKYFYTEAEMNIKELNLYDTLNLKYKDQIVGSNRLYY